MNEKQKIYLVWLMNDETESMLVGVADTMAKAVLMQAKMEEFFDGYEYNIQECKRNTITIDDVDYEF